MTDQPPSARAGDDLRGFLGRLLGWTCELAVEQALASIELATARRAHLVLCGAGDLVPIAYALHRRTFGADRPFIVCDPRRANTPASVRSPANRESGDGWKAYVNHALSHYTVGLEFREQEVRVWFFDVILGAFDPRTQQSVEPIAPLSERK